MKNIILTSIGLALGSTFLMGCQQIQTVTDSTVSAISKGINAYDGWVGKTIIKKLLSLCLFLTFGVNTFAASDCMITYIADARLNAIIKENKIQFDNYDVVCQNLKSANAKVSFSYISSITENQTIATVTVRIVDINSPISSGSNTSMKWDNERTTIKEKQLLMQSINTLLSNISQSDINGLNENRKKLGFKTYPISSNISKK